MVFVLGTLGVAFAQHSQNIPADNRSKQPQEKKTEKKTAFPTAEYNEPDLPDATKNRIRKEKQL